MPMLYAYQMWWSNNAHILIVVQVLLLGFSGCTDRVRMYLTEMEQAEAALKKDPADLKAQAILIMHSRSGNPIIRANAVGFIGRGQIRPLSSEMRTVVYAALEDTDRAVRRAAVEAMPRLGIDITPVLGRLRFMVTEGNIDTAWFAAEALGYGGGNSVAALPELLWALGVKGVRDGPQLRVYAAEALGRMGKYALPAVAALHAVRHDPDLEFRAAVEAAIVSIKK